MGLEFSHETYLSTTKDGKDGHRYWADFDKDFFAQGSYRYAFQGTLHGDGGRDGDLCVTKVFKRECARRFANWVPDLACSQRAEGFARKFSKEVIPQLRQYISERSKIEFVIPLIAKMQSLSHFRVLGLFPVAEDSTYVDIYEHVAIEPYLHGRYNKYNSNAGYEDSSAELLATFCHWTWCVSGHRYMVCDLQGVREDKKYTLTDPCIHSLEKSHGLSDMGVVGMEMVLAGHTCNVLCRQLGLTNPVEREADMQLNKATTYAFELPNSERHRAAQGFTPFFNTALSALNY